VTPRDPAGREDVLALIAPFMDGHVDAGAFFKVAGARRAGIFGALLWGPRQIAHERRAGLGAFTYIAIHGPDVGAFELRWSPLRVHRVFGHWPLADLQTRQTGRYDVELAIDDRFVALEAAAPGPDADDVIARLTSY
jgi:hypothetical protein